MSTLSFLYTSLLMMNQLIILVLWLVGSFYSFFSFQFYDDQNVCKFYIIFLDTTRYRFLVTVADIVCFP